MRGRHLLFLLLAIGCSRAPAPPPAAEPDIAPEPPSAPPTDAPRPAPAAPEKRLVSHLVNGQVYIEEVAVEPAPAAAVDAAVPAPAPAPSTDACPAACAALDVVVTDGPLHRVVSAAREIERRCDAASAERRELGKRLEMRAATGAPGERRALLGLAVALDPTVKRLMLLGAAADDDNDGPAAVEAFRRASALAPDNAAARHELAEAERKHAVEGRFDTVAQEHFTARFEGDGKKELAWESLRILEEAWRAVGDALGVRPSAAITVVFYTGGAYEDATGAREWSAGQFDGKIRVRAGSLKLGQSALRDLLFHEYLHAALVTSTRGDIPAWFHEGLAQRLEPGLDRARELRPLQGRARAELPSLAELTGGFGRLTDRDQVRLYYACALDIVDELARWRGDASFAQLVAAMNAGKTFEAALDNVYALDQRLLQERWQGRH